MHGACGVIFMLSRYGLFEPIPQDEIRRYRQKYEVQSARFISGHPHEFVIGNHVRMPLKALEKTFRYAGRLGT